MRALSRKNALIFFAGLSAFVVLFQVWLVNSARFSRYPELFSYSITVDIAVFIPLLYYFFVIRKKTAPPLSIIFVFIVSVGLAHLILPASHRTALNYFKLAIPVIELVVAYMVFRGVRKIFKSYRQNRQDVVYFSDALEAALIEQFGDSRIVPVIFTELSIIYYSLFGWFKRFKSLKEDAVFFTYHRKSGFVALSAVLLFVFIVETIALHMIVRIWSTPLAWVLTAIGIYSFFWFLGLIPAVRLQPIGLDREHLYIRAGMFWRVTIPLSNIDRVEKVISFARNKEGHLRASVLSTPNFALDMKEPVAVSGPFGIQKQARRIGIYIDDADRFREEMSDRGGFPVP
jgi:hypothetical protein